MSLSRETLLDLMALADGELDGEAKERAEKLATQSAEARRVVETFRAPILGQWLTDAIDKRANGVDGIADAVMSRLNGVSSPADASNSSTDRGALRLVDSDVADSKVAVIGRAAVGSASRPRSRATVWMAVIGVVALAAGVALYVRTVEHGGGPVPPVAVVRLPVGSTSADTRMAVGEGTTVREAPSTGHGVVVDEIDSPTRDISIFQIPGLINASASSVVVWIDDEPGAR